MRDKRTFLYLMIAVVVIVMIVVWGVSAEKNTIINAPQQNSDTALVWPPSGHFATSATISLTPSNPSNTIIYTLDGSEPTAQNGQHYNAPIELVAPADSPRVVSLRVSEFTAEGARHSTDTATYFLGELPPVPLINLTIEPAEFWGLDGIHTNFNERGREWERPAHVTYWDNALKSGFDESVGVRIHGFSSRYYEKKSVRVYFRQSYGEPYLTYPLFEHVPTDGYKRLIIHGNGQDTLTIIENWTMLRNQLGYELGRQIGLAAPQTKPAIFLINGEMRGVYMIGERLDGHYMSGTLGIDPVDLLSTPERIYNFEDNVDSRPHWDALMAFIESNDLLTSENYAHVAKQINIENFIDYNLVQLYMVNNDYYRNNIVQYRPRTESGRWHWALWDVDHGFGRTDRDFVTDNILADALSFTSQHNTARYSLLLGKLLANDTFKAQFNARADELLETTLAPENVIATLDRLAEQVEPVAALELERWHPDAPNTWAENVETMREFARQRPAIMREHLQQQ